MKSLSLGNICSNLTCAKCCLKTNMILSLKDIQRIEHLGVNKEEFCYIDEENFFKLRNINGACFFLENKQCKIYPHRPQGCKFYPIIYNLDTANAILDDECPLGNSISPKIIKSFKSDLKRFILEILKEQQERVLSNKSN